MKKEIHDILKEQINQSLSQFPNAYIALSVKVPAYNLELSIDADRVFHAASLMKVPLMIDLFSKISNETLSLSSQIKIRNRFHSILDQSLYTINEEADDLCFQHLGEQLTVHELIEQMVTVSSNLATNLLIELTTIPSVQATIDRFTSGQTQVLRGVEDIKAFKAGLNNTITASDMTSLLEAVLTGRAISQIYDKMMITILLSQKVKGMIPAGLPADCAVAHKTGEITKIHHDAGIIYPNQGVPIILAILTEGIEEKNKSKELGASITNTLFKLICDQKHFI